MVLQNNQNNLSKKRAYQMCHFPQQTDRQDEDLRQGIHGNPFIKQWSGIFYILSEISQNIL